MDDLTNPSHPGKGGNEGVDDMIAMLQRLGLSGRIPRGQRQDARTEDDVVRLIEENNKIMVVAGAGVRSSAFLAAHVMKLSCSAGIPDFRTSKGLYARIKDEYPELPHPTAIFDIKFFRENPQPFFRLARDLYPGNFQPTLAHYFIRMLEKKGKLLRMYTQNIDTLESLSGIERTVMAHGSFGTVTCQKCGAKGSCDQIRAEVMAREVPYCNKDGCNGVVKPDVVFFGEQLPAEFEELLEEDRKAVDMVIVMGSSLLVQPVASVVNEVNEDAVQVLINLEPIPHHQFDVELLDECDNVVLRLADKLKWELREFAEQEGKQLNLEKMKKCGDDIETESSKTKQAESVNEDTVVAPSETSKA